MTNCIVAGPPRSGAHQVSKFLSNKYKYAWAGEPTIRSRNTPPIHVFKRIQQFKNTCWIWHPSAMFADPFATSRDPNKADLGIYYTFENIRELVPGFYEWITQQEIHWVDTNDSLRHIISTELVWKTQIAHTYTSTEHVIKSFTLPRGRFEKIKQSWIECQAIKKHLNIVQTWMLQDIDKNVYDIPTGRYKLPNRTYPHLTQEQIYNKCENINEVREWVKELG